jgi:hypothetical protein
MSIQMLRGRSPYRRRAWFGDMPAQPTSQVSDPDDKERVKRVPAIVDTRIYPTSTCRSALLYKPEMIGFSVRRKVHGLM